MSDLDVARTREIDTPHGPARVRLLPPQGVPRGSLLVGHGAGGHKDAADVLALTPLTGDGWLVGLVDQPWRVAGRKVATPPSTLDRAWRTVLDKVSDLPRPWVFAGRSAGARVACRTSVAGAASAVVCLAFPLHPPGRPGRSRADELAVPVAAGLPTLVVQGRRDPMGTPEEIEAAARAWADSDTLTLHPVPGSHSPTCDLDVVTEQVRRHLTGLEPSRPEEHR